IIDKKSGAKSCAEMEAKMSDFKERCGNALIGGSTGAAVGGSIGAVIGALGGPVSSALGAKIGGAIGSLAGLFFD
ncbi:MAG: complement resistance protein TraT, partial [Kineothrix sp.]|nr:complement resistance protein TraT [Kineothrix sp.]